MEKRYNLKSPAVKRLMREAKELCEPTEQYYAQPLEDNLFEWHFTVQGPADSEFECGRYHGRITLPPEYPMKPPSIILLTPNGRFEIGKKICLSMSAHHPETWQPSWSIRTVLLAIIGFMPTKGKGAIGALDYTPEERKALAKKSIQWKCNVCNMCNADALKEAEPGSMRTSNKEMEEIVSQITFKGESETKKGDTTTDGGTAHNGDVSSGSINTTTTQSVDDVERSLAPDGLQGNTSGPQQDVDSTKVRRRERRRRASGKRGDGQNSATLAQASGTGFLSTLLILVLVTCLVVLLVRRIVKEYYPSEST